MSMRGRQTFRDRRLKNEKLLAFKSSRRTKVYDDYEKLCQANILSFTETKLKKFNVGDVVKQRERIKRLSGSIVPQALSRTRFPPRLEDYQFLVQDCKTHESSVESDYSLKRGSIQHLKHLITNSKFIFFSDVSTPQPSMVVQTLKLQQSSHPSKPRARRESQKLTRECSRCSRNFSHATDDDCTGSWNCQQLQKKRLKTRFVCRNRRSLNNESGLEGWKNIDEPCQIFDHSKHL